MALEFVDSFFILAQTATAAQPFDVGSVIARLFHMLPAAMMGGGIAYQRLVICTNDETIKHWLSAGDAPRRRWAALVGGATLMLIASGLYRVAMEFMTYKPPVAYHMLLTLKIVLALAVFFITAALAGRTKMAERFRERYRFWLSVNLGLVLTIVVVAATMRSIDKPKKPVKDATPAAVETPAA